MPKNIIGREYGPRWELLDPEEDEIDSVLGVEGSPHAPEEVSDEIAQGVTKTRASVDTVLSSEEAFTQLRSSLLDGSIKRRYRELTGSSYLTDELFPLLRERRVEEAKRVLAAIRRRVEAKKHSSRQFYALFGLMHKCSRTHDLPPIRPEEIGITPEEQDSMRKCVSHAWYEEVFGKEKKPTD